MYNKDKPDKYVVIFFILAYSKYYLIIYIDLYKGNNTSNIDIYPSLHNLPTTQKAAYNAITKSGVANDTHGSRHIYMVN